MKKLIPIIPILVMGLMVSSCDSFLESENLSKKNTSNFPVNETDVDQMITGIYASMNDLVEDMESMPFFIYEMAGDDRFGGGSTSNVGAQAADRLMMKNVNFYEPIWQYRYAGIYRANTAIESIPGVTAWNNEANKNRYLGEAHFLRGYYYLDLVQVFGQVPLVLQTAAVNLPKSSADEVYAQIASDLKTAIELLPATDGKLTGGSRATKWAAEALMTRAWLFYTGYYKKESMPCADGQAITKTQVVGWIDDCVQNSGHELVADQRNIWPYSSPYVSEDYPYGHDNNLNWEGDGCKETVFALKFSNTAVNSGGNRERGFSNRLCEYFNLRDYKSNLKKAFPFCTVGYSNGPVNRKLWDDWAADPDYAGDYRREGSICDIDAELPDYGGAPNKEIECTRLISKKYISVQAKNENGSSVPLSAMYGGQETPQISNVNDLILIRFADVLLMQSELKGDADGLNRVRQRAGLPAVGYSLDAIKKERRYELCFEAVRWNDLRRWGDVEEIVKNQTGVHITNQGHDDAFKFHTGDRDFMSRYKATGGFYMIPESQIVESHDVLIQNDGWSSDFVWKKHPYSTI